jgi:hypothetical protein
MGIPHGFFAKEDLENLGDHWNHPRDFLNPTKFT